MKCSQGVQNRTSVERGELFRLASVRGSVAFRRWRRAGHYLRRAIECSLEGADADSCEVASFKSALASVLLASGQCEAAACAAEAVAAHLAIHGEGSLSVPNARVQLAAVELTMGAERAGTARATLAGALADLERLLPADHPDLSRAPVLLSGDERAE